MLFLRRFDAFFPAKRSNRACIHRQQQHEMYQENTRNTTHTSRVLGESFNSPVCIASCMVKRQFALVVTKILQNYWYMQGDYCSAGCCPEGHQIRRNRLILNDRNPYGRWASNGWENSGSQAGTVRDHKQRGFHPLLDTWTSLQVTNLRTPRIGPKIE